MKLSFRKLINDDIDSCLNIIKEIYIRRNEKDSWDALTKDLSDVLNKVYPSNCLVVLIDNTIVGFGCYVKVDFELSKPNIFYKLTWINIQPKEQGKGIGKKLVNELEEHIRGECKEKFSVVLETDKSDFYEKLGYITYDKNGDNDCMQKIFTNIIYPKILIGTLFSEVKDYVIRDWFKNVCKITYPNFDICLVDNSKDKKYHKKIFKYFSKHKKKSNIGKLTILHTPRTHKKSEVFMAFSANELRKYFLKSNYDWLLNLECDIFPPNDIIERLLSYNFQVIGATYFSGEKKRSFPMIMDFFIYGKQDFGNVYLPYINGFYEMTDTFEPKPILGQGLGAVLLHRGIVEKIPFRADAMEKVHYDTKFYEDLFANNIGNRLIPIMCRHENQTWDIQNKMIGN